MNELFCTPIELAANLKSIYRSGGLVVAVVPKELMLVADDRHAVSKYAVYFVDARNR